MHITVLIVVLATAVGMAQPPQTPPKIEDLEKAVLNARRMIRTVSARIQCVHQSKGERLLEYESTVWFNEATDQWRVDQVRKSAALNDFSGVRHVTCKNCEKPGHLIEYIDKEKSAAKFRKIRTDDSRLLSNLFDPRLLGYVDAPVGSLWAKPLDRIVGRPDRSIPTVNRSTLDGATCWIVRYRLNNGVEIAYWVRPDQGHNIVQVEANAGQGGKSMIRSTLQKVRPTDIWFPQKVKYDVVMPDGTNLESETAEISDVKLNESIPAETFTLKGVQFREGTGISRDKGESILAWQGGKAVPWKQAQTEQSIPEPQPINPPSRPRYWLYVLAGIGLVLACIFFQQWWVRRRVAPT